MNFDGHKLFLRHMTETILEGDMDVKTMVDQKLQVIVWQQRFCNFLSVMQSHRK